MKRIGSAAALMLSATSAQAQTGGDIAGRWRTDDGKAVVAIAPCAGGSTQMCGRIVQILAAQPEGGARDTRNPNRALRSRPLIGVAVFTNLQRDGARWAGNGYSPEEGRNFNAEVSADGQRLTVRGCVGPFCRTLRWARAN